MPFKHYEVPGHDRPLRLSEEHAKALGAKEVSAPDESRPAPREPKAAWVEYATAQGMPEEVADGHTKAELVEQFG